MNVIIDGVEYMPKTKDNPTPADPTEGHSPTPWYSVSTASFYGIYTQAGDGVICASDVRHGAYSKWPANRALILRSVNNHKGLVAFVERCAAGLTCGGYDVSEFCREDAEKLLAHVRSTPEAK